MTDRIKITAEEATWLLANRAHNPEAKKLIILYNMHSERPDDPTACRELSKALARWRLKRTEP